MNTRLPDGYGLGEKLFAQVEETAWAKVEGCETVLCTMNIFQSPADGLELF